MWPFGSDAVVMVNAGSIVRVKDFVVVDGVGMVPSVTRMDIVNGLPVVVMGVPLITPFVNDSPGGRAWPDGFKSKVTGFVPPVAVNVTEYGLFTMPVGSVLGVVMVNWANAPLESRAKSRRYSPI